MGGGEGGEKGGMLAPQHVGDNPGDEKPTRKEDQI